MKEKLTPMMAQYLETKEEYEDCILFYRLGDFYEMFFEDAKTASRELQLTLTGKSCGLEERAPMCGVPYHAADTYIARLIEKGYKVAICEQMEDPALAKGLVKREVVRIVTPGTVVNDSMLDTKSNNYLASVFAEEERTGLVYCDVSTGELVVSDYYGENRNDDVINELIKIDASEIIMNEALRGGDTAGTLKDLTNAYISFLGDSYFDEEAAVKAICRQFSVKAMEGLGIDPEGAYTRALGALLSYLMETQMQAMTQITRVSILDKAGHMTLDRSAVRNLELMETLFEKKVNGSLLGILDHTETAMGSRKLKKWIREPLNKKEGINERLDAVEVLTDDLILRNNLRDALKTVYDLERLTGRVACDKANARDLIALKNSVVNLPDVKSDINAAGSALLKKIAARISDLEDVYRNIDAAILDEPPVTIKEGGLIKDGYSAELDDIKNASSGSLNWIMGLEASEREKTGIKKLKVGYNKVFGYYIEVTKANQDLVPDNYIRKQTLVNSERYVTPELKEMESIVLNAESRINSLEYELFCELREELKKHIVDLQETADAISELDVLLSFAEVGSTNGYVRPVVNDSDVLKIVGGRHPVIEQTISNGVFVSNDTYLDRDRQSLLLITGPNMSGKSTYMRQTALIVLMAQMGCFVPAESVEIGTVDRIYTRIGASDNLTQGQSTFFVEMSELANILNTATERSLVILDEIGRGTSTYDGLSIAWAVVDHLCNSHCHIRTLFASHYHELTLLEKKIKGFKNLNVSVSESDGNVVFLYKIAEGSASKSYGIHVAKIAGVPESVLLRASEKLQELESGSVNVVSDTGSGSSFTEQKSSDRDEGEDQMSFLTFKQHPAVDMIRNLDLMNITPSQAIAVLEELKAAVSEL